MKRTIILLFAIINFVAAGAQSIQKMSPDDLVNYINKADKPLVVSFWATWCSSCVEEIPYFISTIQEKYADRVEILLVSLDIKSYYPEKVKAFAARKQFNVPIAWMSETNADVFCPKIDPNWTGAIPSTLMINNAKQYRKFYEQGLTKFQFDSGLKKLLE
jgi:thiol-disulfide isomerase/thioredoxin